MNYQCCSCLFVSGRAVVYTIWFTGLRPQFPPKINFGGPKATASHDASHVDRPSRTLLTVRPARQDAVYLRGTTTTALCISYIAGIHDNKIISQVFLLLNLNLADEKVDEKVFRNRDSAHHLKI